jgi:prepilin-type N-terminal cleavage/methylation domain-containing protein
MSVSCGMRSMEYRVKNNQDGFTLIEIIITLAVLSIAVVGLLSVFATAITGSGNPVVLNQAIALAQEKMDTITGDRMNSARGFAYIIPGNYPADIPVTGFNRSVTIFCVTAGALNTDSGVAPGAGGCASGYTHVEVTVANDAIGSVSLDGLVTNY